MNGFIYAALIVLVVFGSGCESKTEGNSGAKGPELEK